MRITRDWLKSKNACLEGIRWFEQQEETDLFIIIEKLRTEDRYDYANWLFTRVMTHGQCVEYAVYAAELVLSIFEEKYPKDDRPRQAIAIAKNCAADTAAHTAAAYAAAHAAYAAAHAADTAAHAADKKTKVEIKNKIINYGINLLKKRTNKQK